MNTHEMIDHLLDEHEATSASKRWAVAKPVILMFALSLGFFLLSYFLYALMLEQQANLVKAMWTSEDPVQLALSDTSPRYFYASTISTLLGVCALLAGTYRIAKLKHDT